VIDADLGEILRIAKGNTERSTQQRREVDITHKTVVEGQTEVVVVKRLHSGYAECHSQHAKGADEGETKPLRIQLD
jgi:hypothetical protein